MAGDSDSDSDNDRRSRNTCVSCLSFLVSIGALVVMILGAICLGQEDYTPCGGNRTGALAMVVVGSVFTGISVLTCLIGVCLCCGVLCFAMNTASESSNA